jgi:hypothetical protein
LYAYRAAAEPCAAAVPTARLTVEATSGQVQSPGTESRFKTVCDPGLALKGEPIVSAPDVALCCQDEHVGLQAESHVSEEHTGGVKGAGKRVVQRDRVRQEPVLVERTSEPAPSMTPLGSSLAAANALLGLLPQQHPVLSAAAVGDASLQTGVSSLF